MRSSSSHPPSHPSSRSPSNDCLSGPQASRGLRYDIVITVPLNIIKHRGYHDFQHPRTPFFFPTTYYPPLPRAASRQPPTRSVFKGLNRTNMPFNRSKLRENLSALSYTTRNTSVSRGYLVCPTLEANRFTVCRLTSYISNRARRNGRLPV